VDSPEAWIPQESHSAVLFRGDISQEYTPSNLDELWFKLPSNSSLSSLNWNDFVHIPSSAGMNAESLPFNTADCYLEPPSSYWDPTGSPTNNSLSSSKNNDGLKESYSFPLLVPRNIDIEAELSRQNLYKTELCRSWVESASCKYGNKCQFAHGQHELRPVIRHPKYKTEICKTFHTNGTCPYGKRCRFVHNPAELRMSSPTSSPTNINSSSNLLHHHSEPQLPLLSQDNSEDEEMRQLQERFKLANLAPDPVFYPTSRPTFTSVMPTDSSPSVPSKKGSSLPFFQKLRKQKT